MATESSAVVRFIDVVQREGRPILEPREGRRTERTDSIRTVASHRRPALVVGVLLIAAAAGAAGLYLGRRSTSEPGASAASANDPRRDGRGLTDRGTSFLLNVSGTHNVGRSPLGQMTPKTLGGPR